MRRRWHREPRPHPLSPARRGRVPLCVRPDRVGRRRAAARPARGAKATVASLLAPAALGLRFNEHLDEAGRPARSYFALWAIERRLDLGNPAMNLSRLVPFGDDTVLAECPVYTIHDLDTVGVAPDSIRLIQCISQIVETENFERQLRRQEPAVRRDWSRRKEQIKIGLPSPPRFEKLKDCEPPTWSLRLRDGHPAETSPARTASGSRSASGGCDGTHLPGLGRGVIGTTACGPSFEAMPDMRMPTDRYRNANRQPGSSVAARGWERGRYSNAMRHGSAFESCRVANLEQSGIPLSQCVSHGFPVF
jgi:hypothetical protein